MSDKKLKAVPYSRASATLLEDNSISDRQLRVYLYLLLKAKHVYGKPILVTHSEMAKTFNVSRPAITMILQALKQMSLVGTVDGKITVHKHNEQGKKNLPKKVRKTYQEGKKFLPLEGKENLPPMSEKLTDINRKLESIISSSHREEEEIILVESPAKKQFESYASNPFIRKIDNAIKQSISPLAQDRILSLFEGKQHYHDKFIQFINAKMIGNDGNHRNYLERQLGHWAAEFLKNMEREEKYSAAVKRSKDGFDFEKMSRPPFMPYGGTIG